MASFNFMDLDSLSHLWAKIKEKFVAKEVKTSGSGYKVLSDNNLTDALVEKINSAGTSTFDGTYGALTGKPSIDGHELTSGNQTSASLGLASQSWVTGQGYQNGEQVQQAISTATSGMATQTWVQGQNYATTESVTSQINNAVSSAYEPKGSVAFDSLPAVADAEVGDVYNVTNAFNTTADFVEGASKSYPAGTNVVCVSISGAKKWDVLGGFVDLSTYVQDSDLTPIASTDIDRVCV